jgi:hypothetical protein
MSIKDSVQMAESFQKLTAVEQFALRVVSRGGLENFPRPNLELLQLAIYKLLEPWKDYTGPDT